jgi:phospholipase C
VTVPAISPWNRAVAGDLTSAFDFAAPNDPAVPKLPETLNALTVEAHQIAMPPALPPASPSAFGEEPGTRPSRPTPYELHVTAEVGDDGRVMLCFANTGQQGAVIHAYDRLHLDRIPRRYTVEAGKTLDDTAWDAAADGGAFDLEVHSTNGFLRTFRGNVREPGAAGLSLEVAYDVGGGAVGARLRNPGSAPVAFRIVANAYRKDGPWTVPVAPNATAERSWTVSDSGNWYDFTISARGFERRFAGRMENGDSLISDPAMGS